ncbi:protein of unknown function (DUF3328) domain containing protein [Rhypophila decipiens]
MADTSFRDSDATLSDIEEDAAKTGLLYGIQKRASHLSLRQKLSAALQPRRPGLAAISIVAVLLLTNLLTWNIAKATREPEQDQRYISRVGEPPKVAKVFKDLDLTQTHPWMFESTFHNYGNPWRGRPGPETDAIWENEGGAAFGFIWIPLDEAEEAGITSDHMHFDGKGDQEGLEGYPVHVEVFHQIHCLNLIRMSTWYNSDYYRARKQLAFSHPEEQVIEHVDHCIDNIRQRLMCTADVGLIPFYWVNETGRIGTDPDFQQAHTCRDFSKLHAWMKDNSREFPNVTIAPRPGDFQKSGFT